MQLYPYSVNTSASPVSLQSSTFQFTSTYYPGFMLDAPSFHPLVCALILTTLGKQLTVELLSDRSSRIRVHSSAQSKVNKTPKLLIAFFL